MLQWTCITWWQRVEKLNIQIKFISYYNYYYDSIIGPRGFMAMVTVIWGMQKDILSVSPNQYM